MFAFTFVASLAANSALASPALVLHPEPVLPSNWQKLEQNISDEHPITIRFSLKQRNLDKLRALAERVSDPKNAAYGKYLSGAELRNLTAPLASDVKLVEAWLVSAGVTFTQPNGAELVEARLNAAQAAKLLETRFYSAKCSVSKQEVVRAGDYWLPGSVDDVVSAVYGLHGLPAPARWLSSQTSDVKVTPAVLASTYKISGVTVSGTEKNRQALAEFQGQTHDHSDLAKFFKEYVPHAPSSDASIYKFIGDKGTGPGGDEAELDVQYIMGNTPGLKTEFWYWGGMDFCADLKNWTTSILDEDNAPLVHSVSYGWQGELSEVGCKAAQVQDVDTNFQKLAAKGISIIFASGDSGSGYNPDKNEAAKLYPSWPASSPWVTSVGATRFIDQSTSKPEMASDQFGSGGGFSTLFDAFSDQADAVKHYLETAKGLPPQAMYPAGGRATPDVSALGQGYQVYVNGDLESIGGTSASTPAFAGMISLLNEARIKAGKPAMGYLNKFLYQNSDAFTDVTVGTNAIGRGTGPLKYGFPCAKGWDPATGLGTPVFSKLLAAALKAGSEEVIV